MERRIAVVHFVVFFLFIDSNNIRKKKEVFLHARVIYDTKRNLQWLALS